MTEPTWKDPLLAEWWEGCSEETKANGYLGRNLTVDPSRLTAASLLAFWFPCLFAEQADADRLRALIDAELARGREAVEVLRECEWSGDALHYSCPICENAKFSGHATDCRLAKVIGEKP
jgi:lipopolysaccharide biosynthesis regulator YciM